MGTRGQHLRDYGAETHTYRSRRDVESVKALEANRGAWLLEDAQKWGRRILAGDTYLSDVRIETVRLHVHTLLRHAGYLTPTTKYSSVR